jgi:hypothetical protein
MKKEVNSAPQVLKVKKRLLWFELLWSSGCRLLKMDSLCPSLPFPSEEARMKQEQNKLKKNKKVELVGIPS